jgi:hypothetical protein
MSRHLAASNGLTGPRSSFLQPPSVVLTKLAGCHLYHKQTEELHQPCGLQVTAGPASQPSSAGLHWTAVMFGYSAPADKTFHCTVILCHSLVWG